MFYKYSVILDINPMVDRYDEVKDKMDNTAGEFNGVNSSLQELSIKEQLKFYVDEHVRCNKDKDRMLELIDKL